MDSQDVRRKWAERSGEYSPEYYAHRGSDEASETVRELLETYLGRDAAVLELGCSSGRHLAHLHDHGFDDLTGIDVNADAFDVMASQFPALAAVGTFYHGAIEDVVPRFDPDEFDAVFSVETLQHVHPEATGVFDDLARITAGLLVTVENEGDASDPDAEEVEFVDDGFPLYYRDWEAVFGGRGFEPVASREGTRDTTRAFRPTAGSEDET